MVSFQDSSIYIQQNFSHLFIISHGFVTCISQYIILFLTLTGVMHETDGAHQILSTWLLLAGSISHTSKQYMDFVVIFTVLLDLPYIILLILMGVEFLLCVQMLQNAIISGDKFSLRSSFVITFILEF